MVRSTRPTVSRSFVLLLCIAACLLLNWPILTIVGDNGRTAAVAYLFIVWLCIIFCLLWYCRREAAVTPQELDTEERE